jgi:hypothetical protein
MTLKSLSTLPITLFMKSSLLKIATTAGFAIVALSSVQADTFTFTGAVDNLWYTSGNWAPADPIPFNNSAFDTAGNDALVSSNAIYNAGGDFLLGNGNTMTVDTGSWTQQVGTPNWIKIGGSAGTGTVVIQNGGSFNANGGALRLGLDGGVGVITVASTAGAGGLRATVETNIGNGTLNIQGGTNSLAVVTRQATSALNVSGGTTSITGNLIHDTTNFGSFSQTGGTLSVSGEFKPISNFTMSAGTLTSTLISFADGPGTISLTGGMLGVDGSSFYHGFYGGSLTQGVNFSLDSTGALFFANTTLVDLETYGFLSNGTIQYDGSADTSSLLKTEANGGVYVSVVPIPEPSTVLLISLAGLSYVVFRRRHAAAIS